MNDTAKTTAKSPKGINWGCTRLLSLISSGNRAERGMNWTNIFNPLANESTRSSLLHSTGGWKKISTESTTSNSGAKLKDGLPFCTVLAQFGGLN